MNTKGRDLVNAGKTEDARTFLRTAIQACAGTGTRAENERLAAALIRLGVIEAKTDPNEALQLFRRAMALDPANMRAPQNAGAILSDLGRNTEALAVLEEALERGTIDKDIRFGLEFNAGFTLLRMCAARNPGCDPATMEQHFLRASELNPTSADTFFNLAAIANDIHRDSRRAMGLFKKACDLGLERGCFQYEGFRSRIAAIDAQPQPVAPTNGTDEALALRIRQTYTCPAVVKSTRQPASEGIVTWTVECSDNQVYAVIVGSRGETTVIQKSR